MSCVRPICAVWTGPLQQNEDNKKPRSMAGFLLVHSELLDGAAGNDFVA